METIEISDDGEKNPETSITQEVDNNDELTYEDIEYLDEELETIIGSDFIENLSNSLLIQETDDVSPFRGKITLTNLQDAFAYQADHAESSSTPKRNSRPKKSISTGPKRRSSRIARQILEKDLTPKGSNKQIKKITTTPSPPQTNKRSSRTAKQILEKESDKTIYLTPKGSNKKIKKTTTTPPPPQTNKRSSRKRSRSQSITTAKKSRSTVKKSRSAVKNTSSTAKKPRSSSRRSSKK